MIKFWFFLLSAVIIGRVDFAIAASYLDENPDEVYAAVYTDLGIKLPARIARDPQVWMTLDRLKRERCDQESLKNFALLLDKLGYRRDAANSQYNFVKNCGAPLIALHRSIDLLLKLSDHAMALEVADEYVRRAPTTDDAYYLRGVAFEGLGDYKRALADYTNAIELFNGDRTKIGNHVYARMANAYAKLEQYCEAASSIAMWVAIDPVRRDNNRSQKIIADYELAGSCITESRLLKERYALRGPTRVVLAKGEINGVNGTFIIDTGASFVSMTAAFAKRANVSVSGASEITLSTANGKARGKLTRAESVKLGKLQASKVPVVVQEIDSYGRGVDGLLGLSFLSRFEVQMARGYMEIRTRQRK